MATEAKLPDPITKVTLRTFWSDLPREARLLLSIVVFEFLGTGLVLPFHVVYLHEVRHVSLSNVGLFLSLQALTGLAIIGPGGSLIDKLGARRIMLGVATSLILGQVALAFAVNGGLIALGMVLTGIGFGMGFPAAQAMIATLVPRHIRQRYFGINFALLNLGIGLGGIVGGLFVDVHRPGTFTTVYLLDALSYVPILVVLLVPLRHVTARVDHPEDEPPVSYLALLRRPTVAPLTIVTLIAAMVGYSQLNVGVPAYARAISQVSTRGLGFAFAANTLVIVLLQLVVLRFIEGKRRTRVLAVMGVLWALAWGCLAASGLTPGTWGATFFVAACASVFALGETLLQPSIPAIVNDLAPDHLRGRYNALNSAAFQISFVVAPPITGLLLGHGLAGVYIGLIVGGSLLISALSFTVLEPRIPDSANGLSPAP